jgi:SAM-dependent methyltransferase
MVVASVQVSALSRVSGMTSDEVRRSYAARAAEYTALFGDVDRLTLQDRQLIGDWGARVSGPVLDVGCGPGHWTAFLGDLGLGVEGVDLVPEFVDGARRRFPGVPFRVGSMLDLGVPGGSLGGILAWFSVIHTPPEQVPEVLAGFARAVRPGGSLLLGVVEGPVLEPFDHKVATAWFWPVGTMRDALASAGFEVTETHTRTDPGARPQAAFVAERTKRPPSSR